MISVGGWNVAHPDTSYSGAEWYDKFKKWNKAAAGPGFEDGFDGIDWDLEGNDAMVSPDNTFTVEQLQLVANFSKLAKKDGYLTSIAPPQSRSATRPTATPPAAPPKSRSVASLAASAASRPAARTRKNGSQNIMQ